MGKSELAKLVLADGNIYTGRGFGATGQTLGEAVFSTGMTGYQETLTDPSYDRQIVVATAPQIGNTGWNEQDIESLNHKIWVAGFAIRDLSKTVSNWRAERSLEDEMNAQSIVGIKGIDTRTLVRHLRDHGSIAAGIFSGEAAGQSDETLVDIVQSQQSMQGADLSDRVSVSQVKILEPEQAASYTVVAYDMGIKTNTPRNFLERDIRTVIVPANTPYEDIVQYKPDGVFISNGPGDPETADVMVEQVHKILDNKIPLFGICFGNQILGRAFGMETYKLKFGHRGINVPVQNHITGKIDITAQNHGFALKGTAGESFDTPYGRAQVTHTCLNDGVVEGVALENGLAFSVQYHPEAAAGPHDANPLFDQFVDLLASQSASSQPTEKVQ